MSRYISKLPPEIRELAEKRRSECKHGFGFSSILVDAFSWADTKEGYLFWESMLNENYSVFYTLYPNKNCTCNSRTVDEQGNVVHFEECEKEKDKLDELIDFTDILPLLHLFSILKYKILNLIYKIYFGGCGQIKSIALCRVSL